MSEPKCWYPNGNDASADNFPCWNTTNSPDEFAPCCLMNDYCISSGWCLSTNSMTTYRAGCTDQSWQSDSCVKQCTGALLGGIYKCDDQGHSACELSDCGTSNEFLVASGSMLLYGPQITSVLAASSFVRAADATGVKTTTMTSTTIASASSNCSVGDANKVPKGDVAAVGVGVGLPLLLALITSLVLLWHEKQRRRQEREVLQRQDTQKSMTASHTSEISPEKVVTGFTMGAKRPHMPHEAGIYMSRYELEQNHQRAELGT